MLKKLLEKSNDVVLKRVLTAKGIMREQRGDFGVKEIAITVAAIVIIGVVVSIVNDQLESTWVNELWEYFMEQIKKFTT